MTGRARIFTWVLLAAVVGLVSPVLRVWFLAVQHGMSVDAIHAATELGLPIPVRVTDVKKREHDGPVIFTLRGHSRAQTYRFGWEHGHWIDDTRRRAIPPPQFWKIDVEPERLDVPVPVDSAQERDLATILRGWCESSESAEAPGRPSIEGIVDALERDGRGT